MNRDHPRVCGEHWLSKSRHAALTGSSPRMRGTLRYVRKCPTPSRDHPRVCGEHKTQAKADLTGKGSSPRMRGTQAGSVIRIQMQGIIPAYAGNTPTRPRITNSARDHPRVCGEHTTLTPVGTGNPGSSPRMRGTQHARESTRRHVGIIPAYAGNTND